MSVTPVRPLKRAAETPTGEQRRAAYARTPRADARETPRRRYGSEAPTRGSPRTPYGGRSIVAPRNRDVGTSALRREYPVDRSVASAAGDWNDYEEELRDFQQDTVLDDFKGLPSGTILARDTFHQAFVQGSVPDEVRHALFDADFEHDQYRAVIDSSTGFAAVSTPQQVYAWNYTKRTFASPTCYIFEPGTPTPFVVFIPSQVPQTREPGIVLVDSVAPASDGGSGEILLFENVTLALTGALPMRGRLGMKEGEICTGVDRIDASTLLLSTSHARVLRQSISSNDGRPLLNLPTPFIKPNNTWLSRSSDVLFSGNDQNRGILGLSIGKDDIDTSLSLSTMGSGLGVSMFMGTPRALSRGSALGGFGTKREIWVLGASSVSGWSLTATDVRFLKELAVLPEVASHAELAGAGDIKLRDVATLDHGNIAVLVSFSARPAAKTEGPTSYAIAVVNPSKEQGESIEHFVKLNFTAVRDTRPIGKVKMAVSQKGNVAFVQLPSSIVTVSLEKESLYQQSTTFKDLVANPIIGIGFDGLSPSHGGKINGDNVRLTALASRSGLIGIEVDPIRLFDFKPGSSVLARRAELENKIEQAVFFEGTANPLTFGLPVSNPATLEQALIAVSDLIVTSKSTYLEQKGLMLPERRKRLGNLIQYVRHMGLLDDISQVVRRQLAEDATILAVGIELSDLLSTERRRSERDKDTPEDLLRMAIVETLQMRGIASDLDWDGPYGEAFMRLAMEEASGVHSKTVDVFFKQHLRDIPAVLKHMPRLMDATLPRNSDGSAEDLAGWSVKWTHQAMEIFDAGMKHAVMETRETNVETYELDEQFVDTKPSYLMDGKTVETLQHFYFKAADHLERLNGRSSTLRQRDIIPVDSPLSGLSRMRKGLQNLVIPLLFALEEQAKHEAFLMKEGQDQREATRSKDRLIHDSHRTIFPLISFDIDLAYQVAELFERHYTLVQLAVHPVVGSQEKVDAYMSGEFGRPQLSAELGYRFAQELFKHYLVEKQYYAILSYSNEYRQAVSDFMRRNERHELAWIQFLETGTIQDAGESAFKASSVSHLAQSQKVLLSIAKLALVAQKAKGESVNEARIGNCDKQLSLLKTTELLRSRIRQSGASNDVQRIAHSFLAGHATRLAKNGCVGLEKLYHENVVAILDGRSIHRESLIDLLTAKDVKSAEDAGDFISAMKVLRDWQQQETAETRRQLACLRTIWRRLYLADDWSVLKDPTQTEADKQTWLGRSKLLQVLVLMRGELSSEFLVSPKAAMHLPAEEDVRSRYAAIDAADPNRLMVDLNEEAVMLGEQEGLTEAVVSDLTARAVTVQTV